VKWPGTPPPHETSLVIVAHGTGLNENSAVAAKRQVVAIRDRGIYQEVVAAFMEEEPEISQWANLTTQPYVVIVPFFISDGLHSYHDIPVLLGIQNEDSAPTGQQEVFRHKPLRATRPQTLLCRRYRDRPDDGRHNPRYGRNVST